jgi:hypothetical protein
MARVFVDTNVLFPFSVMDVMLALTEDSVHNHLTHRHPVPSPSRHAPVSTPDAVSEGTWTLFTRLRLGDAA